MESEPSNVRTSWDIFAIISDSTFTFMMGTGGRKTRSKLFARLVNRITLIGYFLQILRGGVKEMLRRFSFPLPKPLLVMDCIQFS
jgi:hypothetical protein